MATSIGKRQLGEALLAGIVALICIVFLHQSYWSLQKIFIGSGEYSILEMTLLKMAVGLITSFLALAICKLVVRRLSFISIAVAVFAQVMWIEFEWDFSVRAVGVGELLIRFAEELGVLVSAALLIAFINCRKKGSRDSVAQ